MWWFIRLLGEKGVLVWFQSETENPLYVGSGRACDLTLPNQTQATPWESPCDKGAAESPYKYLIHCLWDTGAYFRNRAEPSCECWWHLCNFKLPVTGRRGSRAAVGAAARLVDNISETTTSSTCFCTWPHKGDATSTRGRAVKHMALGPEPSHQTVQSGQTTLERLWPTGSQESKNTTKKMCGAVQILYEATMGQHSFPKHPAAALLGFQPFIDCS